MSKLKQAADKALDVQTVKLDDIIEKYGGVVTINKLEYTSYKGTSVPIFGFVEGDGAVFRGTCTKLKDLADALRESYDGNLQEINRDFLATGIRIKIEPEKKTSSGNKFRPISKLGFVDFIDEPEPEFDAETGEVISDEKDPF